MDIDQYSKEIVKTGFVLENKIARVLQKAGWTVISNKYYEDDFEGSVREIDLVAYMANEINGIKIYTTLIISCKKSDSNTWALLSRKANLGDPNTDWWPIYNWSNDKVIDYEITKTDYSKRYYKAMESYGVKDIFSLPKVEVFAFQEMSKSNGTPQNDRNIFLAITSLMKAQAYELASLPLRKRTPSIYQFNLISLIDSDLIRLNFVDDKITATAIDNEQYIARYIINKKESFSRIRFIKENIFERALSEYTRLHRANCKWYNDIYNNFFKDVLKDSARRKIYSDEFNNDILWSINWRASANFEKDINIKNIPLAWYGGEKKVSFPIEAEEDVIIYLNQNKDIRKIVSAALKKYYRYEGEFVFVNDDLPF